MRHSLIDTYGGVCVDFYHMDEESRIRLICKWVVDIVLVVSFAWFIVYAFGTSVTAVSYTHLDVYKRQGKHYEHDARHGTA